MIINENETLQQVTKVPKKHENIHVLIKSFNP